MNIDMSSKEIWIESPYLDPTSRNITGKIRTSLSLSLLLAYPVSKGTVRKNILTKTQVSGVFSTGTWLNLTETSQNFDKV